MWHAGSSSTQGLNLCLLHWDHSLNHWTATKVPREIFFNLQNIYLSTNFVLSRLGGAAGSSLVDVVFS